MQQRGEISAGGKSLERQRNETRSPRADLCEEDGHINHQTCHTGSHFIGLLGGKN